MALNSAERAAMTWIAANVMKTSSVLTDRGLARALTSSGFSSVRTSATTAQTSYVVSDAAHPPPSETADVLARAVPVARFGAADTLVEVRSVVRVGADKVAAAVEADKTARTQAGAELAVNGHLVLNDKMRAVVRNGDLDLRPAAFLALLTADRTVRVVALPTSAAEVALHRPVRTVTIAATGRDAKAIREAAAALPPDYAPMYVTSAQASITVTWAPIACAVQAVT